MESFMKGIYFECNLMRLIEKFDPEYSLRHFICNKNNFLENNIFLRNFDKMICYNNIFVELKLKALIN